MKLAGASVRLDELTSRVELLERVRERRPFRGTPVDWGRKYLPHYHTLKTPGAHVELGKRLATLQGRRGQRISLVGSRSTAKSVILSLDLALMAYLEWREPYILISSETSPQAELLLEPIRQELESNELIARDYPDLAGVGKVWRNHVVVTRGNTRIEAVGSGKAIRGRRHLERRPTLIIVDDPEGDDHVNSPTLRAHTLEWFNRSLMKAGDGTTNVVAAGNAIHRDCLVLGLGRRPQWSSTTWRSIVRWPDRMDLWAEWERLLAAGAEGGDERGRLERAWKFYLSHKSQMDAGAVVLWPERESLYELMLMRADGHAAFEAEKQCNPIDPTKCEWPEKYFDRENFWWTELPGNVEVRTVALDPSKGRDAKYGDYQAIVSLARTTKGNMYVRASMRRQDVDAMVSEFVETCWNFKPDAAVIESAAWQELLEPDVAQAAEKLGYDIPIGGMPTGGVKKPVRIRRLTQYLARGQLRFHDDPMTRLLVQQMRDFPLGDHDDGPDALEMAIRAAIAVFNGRHDRSGDAVFEAMEE